MSYFSNSKDIFLWADGYWCFREDFYSQARQTYTYRLVLENTHQWQGLTGAEPYTRPDRRSAANGQDRRSAANAAQRNNWQSPTQSRNQQS